MAEDYYTSAKSWGIAQIGGGGGASFALGKQNHTRETPLSRLTLHRTCRRMIQSVWSFRSIPALLPASLPLAGLARACARLRCGVAWAGSSSPCVDVGAPLLRLPSLPSLWSLSSLVPPSSDSSSFEDQGRCKPKKIKRRKVPHNPYKTLNWRP